MDKIEKQIMLGCCDAGTTDQACAAYEASVFETTRVKLTDIVPSADRLKFSKYVPDAEQPMSVAEVQQALKSAGFFPGGKVDGICGYRTLSAMRLFQEYARSIDNKPTRLPNGIFDPESQRDLRAWVEQGRATLWAPTIARWQSGTAEASEYTQWLALLQQVKDKYSAAPNATLALVNAFAKPCDTNKVSQWDCSPGPMHLVGIRRRERDNMFDDVLVLLIKGLVFKFQGSTEPGDAPPDAKHPPHPRGLPFLVQGQHNYHFGWHQRKYLALRPQSAGVLVVRSKNDKRLDDADLAGGLEANPTINVHWGGQGLLGNVKSWSLGCQVINGSVYLDSRNELVSCKPFAALNNEDIAANPGKKTRGAYNLLLDLVTALGSDSSPTVKYTLLLESDLELAPELKAGLADARARVVAQL